MTIIIATDHKLQPVEIRSIGPDDLLAIEREQKAHFLRLLREQLAGLRHALVGEEINHGLRTFAVDLAQQHGHEYQNIDMTIAQREAAGIPRGYADAGSGLSADEIANYHRTRERFMYEQIVTHRQNEQDVMIVCGRLYAEPLAQRFRDAGEPDVRVMDMQQEEWFIEDWADEFLRNNPTYLAGRKKHGDLSVSSGTAPTPYQGLSASRLAFLLEAAMRN